MRARSGKVGTGFPTRSCSLKEKRGQSLQLEAIAPNALIAGTRSRPPGGSILVVVMVVVVMMMVPPPMMMVVVMVPPPMMMVMMVGEPRFAACRLFGRPRFVGHQRRHGVGNGIEKFPIACRRRELGRWRGCRRLRAACRSQGRCRSEQTGQSLVHNSSLEGSPTRPLCDGNNPFQALFVPACGRGTKRRRCCSAGYRADEKQFYAAALGRADIA